ncbi:MULTISPECIES: efflux RND transporter periplasmic adaptor subunit [Methylorubrum]|uniref:efflux RND transporter periplasmic adaptor subunit n=1 Tax=Methylorubrum TaxID=2282523 RepID=UPI0020A17EF0|nr:MULTISPECIES: efflux RND transporter periplasmic adaptor subunit [Methylorubrum]MCP1548719.1 RND family efflux transporter MFP subunit [Methylorubrum zatmanii]MCP1554667.1 RND family efflux transporter MFP subunit [Methylorubrum extorquens]MCP1579022.1 RND family efflux transporter MFP subunit [Methylorubrum extorquens]
MSIRIAAALRALAVSLVLAAASTAGSVALAHEGHSHGVEAPALPVRTTPRAEAASATFELVAVASSDRIRFYLDRFTSNEPVNGAQIEIETPDGPAETRAVGDGVYEIAAPWLARGQRYDLLATVTADRTTDVLALDLHLPEPEAAARPVQAEASAWLANLRRHLTHQGPIGAAAGGFLLGLAVIMLVRSRRALPAFAVLALTLTLLLGTAALAHEGHDHEKNGSGEEEAAPVQGAALTAPTAAPVERARRLPGGAVFVPKSMQRLLALRTGLTGIADHRRTVELPGRVVADPNASGVVQSSVGGRLAPPPGGFPNLGTRVRKGEVLATVTPPVQAVDLSDMRQTQGDLDQQIAITGRKVARYERLAATGAVAQTALEDARAELAGLKDRRAALDTIRRAPEELIAPVDGVVAERAAVAGQMAAAGTMVFRIVDPDKLYVEALSFVGLEPGAAATARLPDGRTLALASRGAGLADRNQAVPVQFAITGSAEGVRLGQFVTVLAPTGETIGGLAVPRAGIVRTESGAVVYEHVSAERFEPRPVRVEPLDAEQVIVAGGLNAGRRVVVQGAELLDQVR